MGLAKSAMLDGGRIPASASMSLPHDLVAPSNMGRDQRCMTHGPMRSNLFDETDPKLPTSCVASRSVGPACNQYFHSNGRPCGDGVATTHHYEKPQYCECSLPHSQYSGRYDHLHECDHARNPVRQPTVCETHRSYNHTNPHVYETLGPFSDTMRINTADGTSTPNGHICEQCPTAVSYRHRYEDVEPRAVHVSTPLQSCAGSTSDEPHFKQQPRIRG
uniref:Uncharacterized protein n=1 Tax=Ciona savignyi TaxID=51511 RepID=H2Y6J4_CIOSA